MSQQGSNFIRQGDQAFVIGGKLVIDGGEILPSSESQPSAIVDLVITGTYATDDDKIKTAIDSILTVLRNTGMIAS